MGVEREAGRVALLELNGISKHFGAIQAVNDISLSLEAGEVTGLDECTPANLGKCPAK